MRNCRIVDTTRDHHLEMVCEKIKIKIEIKWTQWRLTCVCVCVFLFMYLALIWCIPQSPISQSWSQFLSTVPKPPAAVWMHCVFIADFFGSAFPWVLLSKSGPAGSHTNNKPHDDEDITFYKVIWNKFVDKKFTHNQSFQIALARNCLQQAERCVRLGWIRTQRQCKMRSYFPSMQ